MPRLRFYLLFVLVLVSIGAGTWTLRQLLLGLPPMAALEDYAPVADDARLRREGQRRRGVLHREARPAAPVEDSRRPAERGHRRRGRQFLAPLGHFAEGHAALRGAQLHRPPRGAGRVDHHPAAGQADLPEARAKVLAQAARGPARPRRSSATSPSRRSCSSTSTKSISARAPTAPRPRRATTSARTSRTSRSPTAPCSPA